MIDFFKGVWIAFALFTFDAPVCFIFGKTRFCIDCLHWNREDGIYCSQCGANLTWNRSYQKEKETEESDEFRKAYQR